MTGIASTDFQMLNNKGIFHAGTQESDIKDERLKPIFGNIDLNEDKQLSQDELDAFYNYLNLKYQNSKKHQKLSKALCNANKPLILGGMSGIIAGIAGAVGGRSVADKAYSKLFYKAVWQKNITPFETKIMNSLKSHWTTTIEGQCLKGPSEITIDHFAAGPLRKTLVWGCGILAAGLMGYGVYKLVSRLSSVKEGKQEAEKLTTELEEEDEQIKKLDEQYKHFKYTEEINNKIDEQKTDNMTTEEVLEIIGITNLVLMMADDDMQRKKEEEDMASSRSHKQGSNKSEYEYSGSGYEYSGSGYEYSGSGYGYSGSGYEYSGSGYEYSGSGY